MMKLEQTLTIDLGNGEICPEIRAKQGDIATRFVRICITCNGGPYLPPKGSTAHFRCRKPDGSAVLNPAVINSDGTVTVELTDQTLAVPGIALADVCLLGQDGGVLSTMSFRIRVELAPLGENVLSESEVLKLTELILRAEHLAPGDSAYEIARKRGFEGTETEWLASLQGAPGPAGPAGPSPEKGVDYFTEADMDAMAAQVLEDLPIAVSEDGFTDLSGLRKMTGLTVTRSEEGYIFVEAQLEGGKSDATVVVLDESGLPTGMIAGGVECPLTWNGFLRDTLDVWEGGSY